MKVNLTKLLEIPDRIIQLFPEIPPTATPMIINLETTGIKEPYSFELE